MSVYAAVSIADGATERSGYAMGLLGPMMVTAAGLGMMSMPPALVVTLTVMRVKREDLAGTERRSAA